MVRAAAKFSVGQLVRHQLFGYRGVIFDVDAEYAGSEEWYEEAARSRPPRDEPWYHVLPDGTHHTTYVAQRNLEPDDSGLPIEHPLLGEHFAALEDGAYTPSRSAH